MMQFRILWILFLFSCQLMSLFIVGAPYGLAHILTGGYISGRIAPNEIGNGFAGMELRLRTPPAWNVSGNFSTNENRVHNFP